MFQAWLAEGAEHLVDVVDEEVMNPEEDTVAATVGDTIAATADLLPLVEVIEEATGGLEEGDIAHTEKGIGM
jgi:hypothetical protein